eukprot:9479314-Alexandrium_andersonii.AAC.1
MHLLWACVMTTLKFYDVLNATYCATLLLHNTKVASKARREVLKVVARRTVVTFVEPQDLPRTQAFNTAVLGILEAADHHSGADSNQHALSKAQEARR